MDYLEEHERRNEVLFDRIDRRLGAIEDRLLATPPQESRERPGVEVVQHPRKAGRKTDGVLRVGLIACITSNHMAPFPSFFFFSSPSNVFASTSASC